MIDQMLMAVDLFATNKNLVECDYCTSEPILASCIAENHGHWVALQILTSDTSANHKHGHYLQTMRKHLKSAHLPV